VTPVQITTAAATSPQSERVHQQRARHEVHRGPRHHLPSEGEEHHRQPVVPGIREHHDDQEGRQSGPVEPERDRHKPGDRADGRDEQYRKGDDAPELARADLARDQEVEDQARGQGVERNPRQGLHVHVEPAREQESDRRHHEDGQDVVGENRQEQVHTRCPILQACIEGLLEETSRPPES
jgi:hypothetical protein